MPTLKRVKQLHKQLTTQGFALIERKGADYNREQQRTGDTLYNLKMAHVMGFVDSPQAGVGTRMCDKIMRMSSLRRPSTKAKVKDEKLKDTVADLINYAVYFYALYEEESERLAKRQKRKAARRKSRK